MPSFTLTHNGIVDEIVTEALITDSTELAEGKPMPKFHYTEHAAWDTGSDTTIVAKEIIEHLGLKPIGKGEMTGIGGDQFGDVYLVHIVLPNGNLVKNVKAISGVIPDYDLLIGMDVILKMDFLITNNPNTVFSFRYPSEGNVELKEQREEKQG